MVLFSIEQLGFLRMASNGRSDWHLPETSGPDRAAASVIWVFAPAISRGRFPLENPGKGKSFNEPKMNCRFGLRSHRP
jgi:hypothetical protein